VRFQIVPAVRVYLERLVEVVEDSVVVDDQAVILALVHPVHAAIA